MKSFKMILLCGWLALFAACSTVSSRIKENERQFGEYPPEAQAQIQNGRIDQGFNEDMVYMALGKPDEKETVTRDNKPVLLWKYSRRTAEAPRYGSTGLSTPYGYPTFGPGPSQAAPVYYQKRFLKVEFENGKVVRWDDALQAN